MRLLVVPLRLLAAVLTFVALLCTFGVFTIDGVADRLVGK